VGHSPCRWYYLHKRKKRWIDIPYDRSDRGMHIGIIKSGDYIFHIYEVKGDLDRNYLYWAWEWEGDMYVRQDIAEAMKKQEG